MEFLLIVERELRQLSRRSTTYRVRMLAALAAALISLGVIAVSVSSGTTTSDLGRSLFNSITVVVFGCSLLAGLLLTADCLSEEKRSGTMGLLFLTDLRGYHIVAGKLVALAMPAVHCLLGVFPILGMCLIMGGVTGGEFARVLLVLGTTLLVSLATAMLVSACCREGYMALSVSCLILLVVVLLSFASGLGTTVPGAGGWFAGLFSPVQALRLSGAIEYRAHPGAFWSGILVNQAVSWACLLLSGVLLPHTWQDRPARKIRRPLAEQLGRSAEELSARDLRYRRQLLDTNPILWLGSRRRRSNLTICLCLTALMTVMFWISSTTSIGASAALAAFIVVYFLHTALKVWMAWESSRRFAEDRGNGALELLLCTPMAAESIWRGWIIHLKRQFLAPVVFLVLVDFMLLRMISWATVGSNGPSGVTFLAGIGLFITDMYALSWVGLWHGLTAPNSTRACIKSILQILLFPAAGCLGVLGLYYLIMPAAPLPLVAMTGLWFATGYITDSAACAWAITKLSEEFRTASVCQLANTSAPKI